jgi:Inner membrane protein YgaP-like, transmembrane domain
MNVDKAVFVFAGVVVLTGLALGTLVNPTWYLLTAFAGLNMAQAGVTGFCPAAMIFRRLGLKPGPAFPGPQQPTG